MKRGSRLWVKSGRGFDYADDQRVADLTNKPIQDSPDAVVIGAGPAGLAVARELDHQHGIKALVLDRAAAPAISWRTRYDNFRLNTTGFLSHLPGQRIPLNAGRWPTKEDMVRYFDHYVQRQNIALLLGCEVHRVDRAAGVWQLDTSSGEIRTPAIVLATGNYSAPAIPPWPGLNRFSGEIVHSGDFTNAWPYRGRDVLVVGAGNSAADIAVQLANDGARRIWLAVRTPPHLVRRAIGPFPSDIFLELFSQGPRAHDRSADRAHEPPDVGRSVGLRLSSGRRSG